MSVETRTYQDKTNGTSALMSFCDNDIPGVPDVNITMYDDEGMHAMTLDEQQFGEVISAFCNASEGVFSYKDEQYGITCTVIIGATHGEVIVIEMSSDKGTHVVNLDAEQSGDIEDIVYDMRKEATKDEEIDAESKQVSSQGFWGRRLGFLKWL